MELEKILSFLFDCDARISHKNSWLTVDVDGKGEYSYTVYNKTPYSRNTKRLYEGHNLASALWCLEHEEQYK